MAAHIEGGAAAHVRWLLVGSFSPAPEGVVTKVSRHNFTETMAGLGLELALTVPDRLGQDDTRSFKLRFDGLSSFKLAGVIERVPVLDTLKKLAEDLGSADPARRPASEEALARAVAAVGEGRLVQALRTALIEGAGSGTGTAATPGAVSRETPAPAAEPSSTPSSGGALDRIFSQAQAPQATRNGAASAIGGFVDSMRRNSSTEVPAGYRTATTPARNARRVIEDAIYATAADLLRAELVQRLESHWRGVKLVVDETPREGDLDLVLVDTLVDKLPGTIEAALPQDRAEWPDAVFVLEPIADPDRLAELAELLAGINVAAVITASDELFGEAVQAAGTRTKGAVDKAVGEAWNRFRQNELARWVCLCGNPAVLVAEGQGETKRTVFGSPAAAAAAMLTASYRETGLFGKVFGPAGGLKAPAVHSVREGHSESMLPVRYFVPISMQTELASAGLVALGSAKNTDKIIATAWPTARASADAVPLPAQIVTGRVVRFALWVRDQIPPGTAEPDIKAVFEQAASVFLFPGIAEGAFLDASVVADEQGKARAVHLDVQVRAALAGIPVHLGFDVPLAS